MEDYRVCKWKGRNSTQIPVFGDWDRANDLPITQYFQCARKAGLIRFRSTSSEEVPHVPSAFFPADLKRAVRSSPPTPLQRHFPGDKIRDKLQSEKYKLRQTRETEMRIQMQKKQRQTPQRKACEATEPARKTESNDGVPTRRPLKSTAQKPVDEDLYTIPPQLLRSSKRNKMVDFLVRCWVPPGGS